MKKILFIMVLVCMILSCNAKKSEPKVSKDEEIYQTAGIKETISYLEKEIKADPANKAYYTARMGYYYIDEGDYKNAESMLKKALEIDSNLGFAYNELGYMYSIQEKKDLALKTYITGTEKDQKMAGNFYGAGILYSESGDSKKAETYLEKAFTLYKSSGDKEKAGKAARWLYFTYGELDEKEKSKKLSEDAIADDIDKAYFYSVLAGIYNSEKNFDKALKYNLDGIKADSEEPENYYGAGINYYYKRNNKQASKYLEKVIPMYKKAKNLNYLGDTYAYLYKINIEEGNKDKADEIEAAAKQELGKENWEKKKF